MLRKGESLWAWRGILQGCDQNSTTWVFLCKQFHFDFTFDWTQTPYPNFIFKIVANTSL